ncbi:mCG144489, partial [Mus musculus]
SPIRLLRRPCHHLMDSQSLPRAPIGKVMAASAQALEGTQPSIQEPLTFYKCWVMLCLLPSVTSFTGITESKQCILKETCFLCVHNSHRDIYVHT